MRSKLPRWAPYAILGPITGPLTLRLVRSLEARRPWLASLYAVAIVETYIALPLLLAALLHVANGGRHIGPV
jgi:hypothetical protein